MSASNPVNAAAQRAHHQRLILAALRRLGPLPRARLAAETGLSAQSVGTITRQLLDARLIDEGERQRGRVGQPVLPLRLNPDAALFFGLKVGRGRAELVLMDFVGQVRAEILDRQRLPQPDAVVEFALEGVAEMLAALPGPMRARVQGMGVAIPFRLWDWGSEMEPWRGRDPAAEISHALSLPVWVENDASCACAAEQLFGPAVQPDAPALPADFLYFYIGHYAGGGLVLDGRLRLGPKRNAGALGSMPVAIDGRIGQLLDHASVARLDALRGLATKGNDPGWAVDEATLTRWLAEAGAALAQAALAGVAVADVSAVVIDGALPPEVRDRLVAATGLAILDLPHMGIDRPALRPGRLGRAARVLGAASLPLSARYMPQGGPGAMQDEWGAPASG